jgi:hypothetical protein
MDDELTPTALDASRAMSEDGKKMLGLALLIGAAARLYLTWRYYCMSSDGVVYIRGAADSFAGNISAGLGSIYPPGYPFLIAGVFPPVGNWELAGLLLSVTLCQQTGDYG